MALIDDLINDIKNKQSVFITGAAGVGKTTILLQLYDILKEKLKLRIVPNLLMNSLITKWI